MNKEEMHDYHASYISYSLWTSIPKGERQKLCNTIPQNYITGGKAIRYFYKCRSPGCRICERAKLTRKQDYARHVISSTIKKVAYEVYISNGAWEKWRSRIRRAEIKYLKVPMTNGSMIYTGKQLKDMDPVHYDSFKENIKYAALCGEYITGPLKAKKLVTTSKYKIEGYIPSDFISQLDFKGLTDTAGTILLYESASKAGFKPRLLLRVRKR